MTLSEISYQSSESVLKPLIENNLLVQGIN